MKKIIILLCVVSAMLGLSSCDQDNLRATYDTNTPPAVSFFQPALLAQLTPAYNGIMQVTLSRTNATEAATVPVVLTSSSTFTASLFTLLSTNVTFAQGSSTAVAEVQFDIDKLATDGSQYKFTLSFADPNQVVSFGGNVKTDVTASRKLTWQSAGTGQWLFSTMWGIAPEDDEPVKVEQALEAPGLYRFVDFFTNVIIMTIDFSTNVAAIAMQDTGIQGTTTSNVYMECTGTYNPTTKIVSFPRVNANNPRNYYYTYNSTTKAYSPGWYLQEEIQMP